MNSEINYQAIGYIQTPFMSVSDMPIQPCGANGAEGIIELNPDGIIIGKSIIDAEDPAKEAKFYHDKCTPDLFSPTT